MVLPELLPAGDVQAAAQEEHAGHGYGGEGGNIDIVTAQLNLNWSWSLT